MTRRPDLFLIGAPKCGTTSLYEYLGGHPEVFMSPRKEPQYFDSDPARPVGMRYGDDLDDYLSLFAAAGDAKRLGEASTAYLFSPLAPDRLRQFQANPFLIVCLRDPVEMLHALHGERLAAGVEPAVEFGAALADEQARASGARGPLLEGIVYRPWARFGEQLERWLAVFGRDRIHVILLEDLIRDPAVVFSRLLEFVQVDPDYQPATFARHNPSHRARSRIVSSLMNARAPRRIVRRIVPMSVRNWTTLPLGRLVRRVNSKRVARSPIDPGLRAELAAELQPDVRRLGDLLGADLEARWWGGTS